MQGIIELHGAKQVLNAGSQRLFPISETCFLPGDIAVYNSSSGTTTLVRRTEQKVIAVVLSISGQTATLCALNFGPTCPFRLRVAADKYNVSDRLVVKLHSNSVQGFTVLERYSNAPAHDVKCLVGMYRSLRPRLAPESTLGRPLYTKTDIVNHNDLTTYTIDPTTSVDFDDAISVDVEHNTVYVHIVDIANQPVSNQSLQRLRSECLTLYLSNEHTEHLLDAGEASFDLSLVVGHERPVITVKIVLDDEGLVSSYDIYRSTIVVKYRFDYATITTDLALGIAPPEIVYLANLTKKRNSSVNYSICLPSLRILSNTETGEVSSVHMEETNDVSHSLVATAMILANLTVSKHLSDSGIVLPNRFHETLRGMQVPDDFVSTGNIHVDSFIIVKRYARAYYAVDKKGHFGLGLKDYVHFTSPMRRYADVLVHRILAGHHYKDLESEVSWLNHRASLVRAAQDMYVLWKKVRWLKTLPGPHEIWITGVSKAGILWFMPSLSLNGFLHVSGLEPKQFWLYDGARLCGADKISVLSIGDKLSAVVNAIDENTGEVQLRQHLA